MERFVRLVVGGGVATLAGTWVAALAPAGSTLRTLGVALALVGAAVLLAGIERPLDYRR